MTLQSFREKVNLAIYDSKEKVDWIRKAVILFVSIVSIITLAIYYGYPQTPETKKLLINIIQAGFLVYVINYFIQFIYDFEPLNFIKRTWFEALIMGLLIAEGISHSLTGNLLLISLFERIGVVNISGYYALFVQFYFLLVILTEVVVRSNVLPKFQLDPSAVFIFTFIFISLLGAVLLMMPEMTTMHGSMNFLDALFTSTSATCVTGLIVVDTATFFTAKGQFVIMMLIVVGGINIISFGSFIALASKVGVTLKHHSVVENFVNKSSMFSSKSMLGRVLLWVFTIELMATVLIYFSWSDAVPFKNFGDKVFYSVFHAVSAFNNAGFSIFTDGLYNTTVRDNSALQIIIALVIFFGSLGILTLIDLFSFRNILDRIRNPWKQWQFGTKIAFYFSVALVIAGTVLFYLLEASNTLYDKTFFQSLVHSFFQSVTTRTAGFNTIDLVYVSTPALFIMVFLMFIGASSGSTGGGD